VTDLNPPDRLAELQKRLDTTRGGWMFWPREDVAWLLGELVEIRAQADIHQAEANRFGAAMFAAEAERDEARAERDVERARADAAERENEQLHELLNEGVEETLARLKEMDPPRWEDDKVVERLGFDSPDRCRKCGEENAELVVERARADQLQADNDTLHDDLTKILRHREACLTEAALTCHTGPDGEDYLIREELMERWRTAGWEEFDEQPAEGDFVRQRDAARAELVVLRERAARATATVEAAIDLVHNAVTEQRVDEYGEEEETIVYAPPQDWQALLDALAGSVDTPPPADDPRNPENREAIAPGDEHLYRQQPVEPTTETLRSYLGLPPLAVPPQGGFLGGRPPTEEHHDEA
jgi:hypothetical protein